MFFENFSKNSKKPPARRTRPAIAADGHRRAVRYKPIVCAFYNSPNSRSAFLGKDPIQLRFRKMRRAQMPHRVRRRIPGAIRSEQDAFRPEGADGPVRPLDRDGAGGETRIDIDGRVGKIADRVLCHILPAEGAPRRSFACGKASATARIRCGRRLDGRLKSPICPAVKEHDHPVFGAALIERESALVVHIKILYSLWNLTPRTPASCRRRSSSNARGESGCTEPNGIASGTERREIAKSLTCASVRGATAMFRQTNRSTPPLPHDALRVAQSSVRMRHDVRALRQRLYGAGRQFIQKYMRMKIDQHTEILRRSGAADEANRRAPCPADRKKYCRPSRRRPGRRE